LNGRTRQREKATDTSSLPRTGKPLEHSVIGLSKKEKTAFDENVGATKN